MRHINGFTVAISDSSPYSWTGQDFEWSSFDESAHCPAKEAHDYKITLDCLAEAKRILDEANVPEDGRVVHMTEQSYISLLKQLGLEPAQESFEKRWAETKNYLFETSPTNSSLIGYTSSVNCTNIEDRTMNTKDQLAKVKEEIKDLRIKLDKDVRKHDGVLLQAHMDACITAPEVTADFLSAEWCKQRDLQQEYIEKVNKGVYPEGFHVSLRTLHMSNIGIVMDSGMVDAIEEFEDHIEHTYVYPMMRLLSKKNSLKTLIEAERDLARTDEEVEQDRFMKIFF